MYNTHRMTLQQTMLCYSAGTVCSWTELTQLK